MKEKFLREYKTKASERSIEIITSILNDASLYIKKPLEIATYEDILTYIEYLQQEKYAGSTITLYKTKLKQFYSYCFNETDDSKYRKLAKKLSGKIESDKKLLPQDILTESDVLKMVNISKWERDRCILMVLWESGMRIGELLNLTKSDVEIIHDRKEVTFHIPDKTGCKTGHRSVMCTKVYFYVIDWLKCNPSDKFVDISIPGLNIRLQTLAKNAGITKLVNPHAFRHGAITHAVTQKMPEIDIKLRFWGNINSAMLSTYVHLSAEMSQDAYRQHMGGKPLDTIKTQACIKCGRPVIEGDLCASCTENKNLNEKVQSMEALIGSIAEKLKLEMPTDLSKVSGIRKIWKKA